MTVARVRRESQGSVWKESVVQCMLDYPPCPHQSDQSLTIMEVRHCLLHLLLLPCATFGCMTIVKKTKADIVGGISDAVAGVKSLTLDSVPKVGR